MSSFIPKPLPVMDVDDPAATGPFITPVPPQVAVPTPTLAPVADALIPTQRTVEQPAVPVEQVAGVPGLGAVNRRTAQLLAGAEGAVGEARELREGLEAPGQIQQAATLAAGQQQAATGEELAQLQFDSANMVAATENAAREELRGLRDAHQKALDDFTQATANIRPSAQLLEKRADNKIRGLIAVGLGALASAFTGQPNQLQGVVNRLWDGIDREIDKDIQLQKEKAASFKERASVLVRQFDLRRQAMKDDVLAISTETDLRRKALLSELESKLATSRSRKEAAGIQAMLDEGKARNALDEQKILAGAQKTAIEVGLQRTQLNLARLGAAQVQPETQFNPDEAVPIKGRRFVGSKAEAEKLRDKIAGTNNIVADINQLAQLVKGFSRLSPTERAQVASLGSEVILGLKGKSQANLGAALTEPEKKILEGITGDPFAFFRGAQIKRLTSLRTRLGGRLKSEMRARNLQFGPSLQRTFGARGTAQQGRRGR